MQVTLFSKLDCHLCDEAYQILLDLAFETPLEIEVVDITLPSSNLEAEYGERIPVLAARHTPTELNWPFSRADVATYLGLAAWLNHEAD